MRGFVLDTNVASEFIRERPAPLVLDWFRAQNMSELFLSAISAGELAKGFHLLPLGRRRSQLQAWLNAILSEFGDNILPVTRRIAERWGELDAQCKLRGRPHSVADGLIAATGLVHGLTVVTRNVKDFHGLGVEVFNPWNPV